MLKSGSMVPIAMVLAIAVLGLVAITSGRSNAPDVTADANYPHHICTFNDYCVGGTCSRTPFSFVAYLSHADGEPRLDMPGVSPRATLEERPVGLVFTSRSDQISGTLEIQPSRNLNWVGTSGSGDTLVEHYGTGKCERLRTP